jgi:hypothetical protein
MFTVDDPQPESIGFPFFRQDEQDCQFIFAELEGTIQKNDI